MTEAISDQEQRVRDGCARWLTLMAEQREFTVPLPDADGHDVHDSLRYLRTKLDAAEVILAEAAREQQKAHRRLKAARGATDDSYDEHLEKLSKRAVTRQYESIQDRTVMARVSSSQLRKAARAEERISDIYDETVDALRSMFFAMRDIRRELLVTLEHYLPWEASLER